MYREADSSGSGVWPTGPPSDSDRASYAEAEPVPFWLDRRRPARRAPLEGPTDADLVVVGGGLTGLWAALTAIERDPDRRIVVLESEGIATGASGRNGGFMSSSLVISGYPISLEHALIRAEIDMASRPSSAGRVR